jgi:hypothetical protein
MDEYKDQVS